MSEAAQDLIGRVRDLIAKQDYSGAMALIHDAPADRSGWTSHDIDEVTCLGEFLHNLSDPAFSAQPA